MAIDTHIKMDGIKGEARDEDHKGEIEVLAFDWSLRTAPTGSFGGGGATRPVLKDLRVIHHLQSSSPQVMLACASGKHFDKAILTMRRTIKEKPVAFLKVTMEECLISSYRQAGSSGDEVPADSLSLNFSKITFEYKFLDGDGSVLEERATWDLAANKGV